MISFTPLASSSAGNAYRVTDGTTTLLLEAGIRFADLRKALDFRMSDISCCLLSHCHGDHSKSVADVMKAGIDVYTSQGTIDALKLTGHRVKAIKSMQQFTVGTWTIMPFDVQHDVEEPLGFLLANRSGEKLMFATDTYYLRYYAKGLTHMAVECNYSLRILDENIAAGRVPMVMRSRLMRSHFSLENMLDMLRAHDLSKVQEIHLLHLSDTNSDAEMFKREVQQVAGCPVYVAERRVG